MNKYSGLAEYLVKRDHYLGLNLEQAKELVKLVEVFFSKQQRDLEKKFAKELKASTVNKVSLDDAEDIDKFSDRILLAIKKAKAEKKKKLKPFVGSKYVCKLCKNVIQSKYSGHWVSCLCGKSYVDQTEHYTRCGGEVRLYKPKKGKKQ